MSFKWKPPIEQEGRFNLCLKIAYDGTCYKGWQKTKMGPSIESVLQENLEKILQSPIELQAASRTDAGVHADAQVVNFFVSALPDLSKLLFGLNCLLPKDVRVLDLSEAPASFHPTTSCKSKKYRYYFCHEEIPSPFNRLYSWHFPRNFDVQKVQEAIPHLIGTQDFRAFCNNREGPAYKSYERTIEELICVETEKKTFLFEIKGNSFLYKMVRNLVGTLVYVGIGKILPDELPAILTSQNRTLGGITAPAHGLFLHKVYY